MGRRADLSYENMERKAEFWNNNKVYMTTTDRLLEGTQQIDLEPKRFE